MATKSRIHKLIDDLPDDEVAELELLLEAWRERRAWDATALEAFAANFDEDEVEYTLEDAKARPK